MYVMKLHESFNTTVTVSETGEMCIPEQAVHALGLSPGSRVVLFRQEGRIVLMPAPSVDEMYGMFPGISTEVERDREDRV